MTTPRRARAAGLGSAVSVSTLMTLLPLLSMRAVADDAAVAMTDETARALRTCIAENEDSRRLACYDAALKRPAGRATKTTPEQRFGLSAAQVVKKENIAAAP